MVTEWLGEDRDLEYSKLFVDNSTYSADPMYPSAGASSLSWAHAL